MLNREYSKATVCLAALYTGNKAQSVLHYEVMYRRKTIASISHNTNARSRDGNAHLFTISHSEKYSTMISIFVEQNCCLKIVAISYRSIRILMLAFLSLSLLARARTIGRIAHKCFAAELPQSR